MFFTRLLIFKWAIVNPFRLSGFKLVAFINYLLADWKDRWKYVDDTTTTETIDPDCNSNLQELVNYIDNWTTSNNMKLNIGKYKELVIDFAKKKHCFPPLTVDEVNIERVKSARILGLTVQDNMKWHEHINNIVKKASKRLYMLRLLKRSNSCIDTLITVYTTIIRPLLEYACGVPCLALQYPTILM